MNHDFFAQFAKNIKFSYRSFDRVMVRGYIRKLCCKGFVVLFLKAMGFRRRSNGVMRIFTDQHNFHISKQAANL